MANQIVAYQDERHGLGAWVAEQVAAHMFRYGMWLDENGNPVVDDSGAPAPRREPPTAQNHVASAYGMSLSTTRGFGNQGNVIDNPRAGAGEELNFAYKTWTSPRTSADATFSTVISNQAQLGVVPLYDNDGSFSKETLGALIDFPQNKVLREYVAESNYVLAAPADLIHEIEQAGYTDSFSSSGSTTGFQWNRDKQLRFLRKVTQVYASADAMKHCAAALDGLRAKGVDVQLIPDGIDTYREGLRIASDYLDPTRRVETHFSGSEHKRVSRTAAKNHNKPVIAVLLSHDKAMSPDGSYNFDSDYVVLDAEMAGADRIRTSFIAMTKGIPAIPSATDNRVRFEMAAMKKHFEPSGVAKGGIDHRALYPLATDSAWPERAAPEIPAYARFIYKFDTIGNNVGDYSAVLRVLNEEGFSYRTTTLDNRPGAPMVVAIDVPAPRWRDMRSVVRVLAQQHAVRRLADFPALRPMVAEAARPETFTTGRMRTALSLIGVVVAAVLAFVLWKM
ncbi:MAG: hypothetical protein ACWA5T_02230 [Parvularcula sp.]